jgi:type 2 lantibiotic biosynthesis protein LanM
MDTSSGFITLLAPQIRRARLRLRAALDAMPAPGRPLPQDQAALETLLLAEARAPLVRIITPTLALELNVARLRSELRGETPEQRYESYLALLARPAYRAALEAEYPALYQMAAERLDRWGEVSLELIDRLVRDWPAIQATFFGEEILGELVGLRYPQGSTKHGGRSVVVLTFASGAKLVYKPRSLAVENSFQELLAWLNEAGFEPPFRPVGLLDCGTHGWMEWIDPVDCADANALSRFYRRQGAYLALFYALEATDIHLSNVIATGEHPLLIDLEALFHPRDATPDWPALDVALDEVIYYSVLRPGLLPEPEKGDDEALAPLDLSGLAGASGQTTPYTVPTWRERGTDRMRLEKAPEIIRGGQNLPSLNGRAVDPLDYGDALEQGFSDAHRLLMANKTQLLSAGGILSRFAHVETRVLPRSGRNYGELLEAGYHPDLLRDPHARACFFQRRLQEDSRDEPELARLIPLEVEALLSGDVPLFVTAAGSRDLVVGDRRIANFFPRSGLEIARRRVAALDESDLLRQRWFIRASLATLPAASGRTTPGAITRAESTAADLPGRALAAARLIGEHLAQTAIVAGDEASWIGLEPDSAGHWAIEPLGDDLAHGLPGVALFLAQLAAISGEPRWGKLAVAALSTHLRHAAEESEESDDAYEEPIGLFDGVGGRLYALSQPALLAAHPAVPGEIHRLVDRAAQLLDQPAAGEETGLAHGLDGLLAGLLAAHLVLPGSGAISVARAAGDLLLARGFNTTPAESGGGPMATFYHGSYGAMVPLLALAELTGDDRYRAAAGPLVEGLLAAAPTDLGAWQSYLMARPWLLPAQTAVLDPALRAAAITQHGPSRDHSLAQGDMGILDLLYHAADALDDAELRAATGRFAAAVVADIERHGWRPATPLGVITPGWATGLAGIGYGLLRVAAPQHTPAFPALVTPVGVNYP